VLESRFAAVLRRYGVPRAVYQYTVRSGGRFIARVDFAYPECRLAVEVDGHDSHRTPAQLQSDLTRQNLLVAEGWTILRFTWADVVQRPDMVAEAVLHQLARLPRI
jgi:very-short-patch-repair endonuclease